MESEDVGDKLGGDVSGGVGVLGRDEVGLLCEAVDADEDGGVTLRRGEFGDVVDGDRVPGAWGDRERGQEAVRFVVWWLGPLACIAGPYVVVHEGAHTRPVEVAGDDLQGFGLAEVSCREAVVGFA